MSGTRLMTPEEIGERLGIEPDTARLWLRTGELPGGVKIGARGLLRLPEEAFEEYVTNLRSAVESEPRKANAATKANASRTPEQRSEASRKANLTRVAESSKTAKS